MFHHYPSLVDADRGDASTLIAVMHHPPHPGLTGAGWSRENGAQRLLAEAAIADVDLIVAGHAHALRDFPSIDVGGETLRQVIDHEPAELNFDSRTFKQLCDFGKSETMDDVAVHPILIQKGETKMALYGLGSIRDERLHRTWANKKVDSHPPRPRPQPAAGRPARSLSVCGMWAGGCSGV